MGELPPPPSGLRKHNYGRDFRAPERGDPRRGGGFCIMGGTNLLCLRDPRNVWGSFYNGEVFVFFMLVHRFFVGGNVLKNNTIEFRLSSVAAITEN